MVTKVPNQNELCDQLPEQIQSAPWSHQQTSWTVCSWKSAILDLELRIFSLCWKSVFGFEFEFACTICNLTKSSRKKSRNVERIKKNWHKDSLKYWVWIKLKCLSHIIENNMVITEMCFTYWLMRTSRAQTQLVGFKISQPSHLCVLIRRTCCYLCSTHINIGTW